MTSTVISERLKNELRDFLRSQRSPELLTTYLFFLEKKFNLHPVAFVRDKIVYPNVEEAVKILEGEGNLWHKTEIKIGYGTPSVNERTKKIYICPFTGKVFGDNTHPNPQDAIYDWVSKCPENKEIAGGVKAKRFFVSEDPEVIRNYIKPPKESVTKTVFSSAITGKLFNTKEAVIKDFKENYLKPMTLGEVQNQNRFQLHQNFLELIQQQLQEDMVASFVEAMAEHDEFHPYVSRWVEEE
jgi:hypothetical protein